MTRQDNRERDAISGLLRAMCRIQCGSITVVKQDGCVVQITTVETAAARTSDRPRPLNLRDAKRMPA